ncbi:MAG: peptidase C11 [Clostridia bacterium]|nr:peptidase C11 [Clostridia bacterium]
MPNAPLNRKKNVTGKASQESTQTHGPGMGQGPVGASDGYKERKEQQRPAARTGSQGSAQPSARPAQQRPVVQRPSQQSSQRPVVQRPAQQSSQRPGQQRPAQQQQTQTPFAARPQQSQKTQQTQSFQQTGGNTQRSGTRSGGGMKLIIIAVIVLLLGGGGGLSGLFGGGGNSGNTSTGNTASNTSAVSQSSGASDLVSSLLGGGTSGSGGMSSLLSGGLSSLLGGGSSASGSAVDLSSILGGSWFSGQSGIGSTSSSASSAASSPVYTSANSGANYTALNRNVAAGSRNKFTALKGNGRDTVTLLVYMCGADLESKSAMATKDLQEMLNAKFGSNVNLVVYTGGSTNWRNNMVSSSVNQIWQIQNGKMVCLEQNAGTGAMTDPDTLTSFIQYGKKNFKASRYGLILWDHGSGSVAGYGYDERNPRAGQMSLAGLNSAFKNGGLQFDFIGFDTCLMASVENALMASNYADYLIASEETEPGIGWYYTDWLTALGENTSISTLDLGKKICDDFVSHCASECRGQQTTLSLIDLAELANTVPAKLSGFADAVTTMVTNQEYKTVSNARNGSREFAASSRIDQVDLTDLCNNLGTSESAALAKVLREAVKYNRTNISDAYGLSVYFPYQRVSNVDKAVSTYAAIGMDDSYSKAIRAFASVEASGQAVTGGASSAIPSLFGMSSGSTGSGDLIGSLLSSFLGGGSGMDFLSGRTLTEEQLSDYLTANILDAGKLVFQQYDGQWVVDLPAEQWALVHGIDKNLFYDNGAGYVDLGLDNLFEIDPQTGLMIADAEATWLAVNGQIVAYYHETSEQLSETEWRITGRVPCLLNGDRAELLIVFDQDQEGGYVAGARSVYQDEMADAVAKNMTEITAGDEIVFLADLYDYQQNYTDSYRFGNPITVGEEGLAVSDVELPDAAKALITYRFTDIYNQAYWTPVLGR